MIKELKKQNLGALFSIGGHPDNIIPLTWQLYNYNYLFPNQEYQEPLDLGAPENFQYFLIEENKYINGRTAAFCNVLGAKYDKFKGKKGGSFNEAYEMALQEWESIQNEVFLKPNDEITISPYHFGIFEDKQILPDNSFFKTIEITQLND